MYMAVQQRPHSETGNKKKNMLEASTQLELLRAGQPAVRDKCTGTESLCSEFETPILLLEHLMIKEACPLIGPLL